jgi:hypothetical protein
MPTPRRVTAVESVAAADATDIPPAEFVTRFDDSTPANTPYEAKPVTPLAFVPCVPANADSVPAFDTHGMTLPEPKSLPAPAVLNTRPFVKPPEIRHTTNTLYALVLMLVARFPVSPCDPPNVNTLRLFKALLVSVGRSPPLAVTSFPLLLLSFQVSTKEPFSVMLAADESAPSNHNEGVAISSGLATATTGPASVV